MVRSASSDIKAQSAKEAVSHFKVSPKAGHAAQLGGMSRAWKAHAGHMAQLGACAGHGQGMQRRWGAQAGLAAQVHVRA